MRAAAEPGPPARAAAGSPVRRRAARRRGPSYFVREGVAGFWRSGLMSVAAVTITMVTLVALGVALVVAGVLDQLTRSVERRAEVAVYLSDSVRAGDLAVLRARLLRLPGVTGLTYVSKDEALSDFQQTLGGKVDLGELLSRNPLPASFRVAVDGPDRLRDVAGAASTLPHVEHAGYGAETADRMLRLTRAVRLGGAAAGGLLALAAVIIVLNTIRLTVFARRAEIEVMRLVGATAWFIRWPFVVEGALTGAAGALAALVLVAGAYTWLAWGARLSLPFLLLPSPQQVALMLAWKLMLWGVLIGIGGSLLAVRRYLSL